MTEDPSMRWAVEDALVERVWRDEILALVLPLFDHDRERALVWMRDNPIPEFSATAEELIADGRGESALRYLQQAGSGRL